MVQYPKGSALFINVGVYETRDSTWDDFDQK
jgi:hypothetical protein